jgi:uncharacterized OsmC-like protein
MVSFTVNATRRDHHLSVVSNESSEVLLGTDLEGNDDALNPMELLMGALCACMLKGINRVAPLIGLTVHGVAISVSADRQDTPPRVAGMRYRIVVDSPDSDEKLALLHDNLVKFGTVTNTIAAGTQLTGELVRA